jgi:hypothetical protein
MHKEIPDAFKVGWGGKQGHDAVNLVRRGCFSLVRLSGKGEILLDKEKKTDRGQKKKCPDRRTSSESAMLHLFLPPFIAALSRETAQGTPPPRKVKRKNTPSREADRLRQDDKRITKIAPPDPLTFRAR